MMGSLLTRFRIWTYLVLAGSVALAFAVSAVFYYFGDSPDWVIWLIGGAAGLILVGLFGWIVTFDADED
jgi:hypothetical protein